MARKKSVPTGKNEISRPKDMAHPPEEEAQLPLWIESSLDALVRFRRYGRDTGGVMLVVVSSMTLLALIGRTSGAWLTPWASLVRRWLGWGSIFMVIGLGAAGLLLMRRKEEEFTAADWGRVISLELSAVAGIALLAMLGGQSLERAEIGLDGGLVGWGIVELTSRILSFLPDIVAGFLTGGMFLLIFVFGAVYGLGMLGKILQRIESLVDEEPGFQPKAYTGQPAVSVAAMPEFADKAKSDKKNKQHAKIRRISEEHRKEFKIEEEEERETAIFRRDERLPPLDLLLNDKSVKPNERYINETAGMIEQTLAEFGIPAKVVGFQVGPTITQFAVEPGYVQKPGTEGEENRQKVRVSQISGLLKDLALALSAQRLRIQAPVPGRSYVGIEVPNKIISMVGLRAILESEVFHKEKSPLAMAMGRDVSGNPLVADLASMPHLLIAGTTGSGKSVFIEAMTICLVMNNTPDELRLVMVDPKMVELVRFNGLPHLYGKVETELERINGVLRWVVAEMQRRYKLLEELHARDLEGFNRKAKRRKEYEHLPRIVVMIDELADLMMSAGEQTEATIVRLAQMARAVGIHLIVATQRPSTDVVTGLIKANFPARLSFAVASGIDSRVILDFPGAESLLGRGDMLFLSPEEGVPMRAQGVMISEGELENVISYWQDAWEVQEEPDVPWEKLMLEEAVLADRDDLIEKAIAVIRETGRASSSLIQRRLKIGYPRAARLMDELEDLGVVGSSRGGGKPREILIALDDQDDYEDFD